MIKRALTVVNAQQITASVFINDDESGLHRDYEVWLEKVCSRLHPAPHAPVSQYQHNRTGEDNADAHLKRNAKRRVARDGSRGGGCRHQWPPRRLRFARRNLWHVGTDLGGQLDGWHVSLDGRRRKRVLVKIIGE